MLVTTAIFWCPIAKKYARMYKLFFFSERGFFCVCVLGEGRFLSLAGGANAVGFVCV
jgi:hypothetical protein